MTSLSWAVVRDGDAHFTRPTSPRNIERIAELSPQVITESRDAEAM